MLTTELALEVKTGISAGTCPLLKPLDGQIAVFVVVLVFMAVFAAHSASRVLIGVVIVRVISRRKIALLLLALLEHLLFPVLVLHRLF